MHLWLQNRKKIQKILGNKKQLKKWNENKKQERRIKCNSITLGLNNLKK